MIFLIWRTYRYILLFALVLGFSAQTWALQIYRSGNPADLPTQTNLAVCLAGGGSDDAWAEGWNYLLRQANGGDVVVIRSDGRRGEYEGWIFNDEGQHGFAKVNSVTTLVIESLDDAERANAVQAINHAELIFFAGGDQANYIKWLVGSSVSRAVMKAITTRHVPIGGTSAGMALLAGIDFSGKFASPKDHSSNVTSDDVLQDPTGYFVDLDRNLIVAPFLNNVVTDTHFSQRGREGRLVGFMARAIYNRYNDIQFNSIKGIAADEDTAACYGMSGVVKVFGQGNVFFLKGQRDPERLQNHHSLDWNGDGEAVSTYVVSASHAEARFNLKTWSGIGGTQEFWAVHGVNEEIPILIRR